MTSDGTPWRPSGARAGPSQQAIRCVLRADREVVAFPRPSMFGCDDKQLHTVREIAETVGKEFPGLFR